MATPKVKPIRVGERIVETWNSTRTITVAGHTAFVSEPQYEAIVRAAQARKTTVELFLSGFNTLTVEGARAAMRNAITPYLPKGYTWPVAVGGEQ